MKRLFLLMVCFAILSVSTHAQVTSPPSLMNFQGRLTKPDGTPIPDGNYAVRFSLWSAVTGGTEQWNQTRNPVTVRNGTFTVLLSGFPAGTFNANLYLEIRIGTELPLTPRQQLVSVAYAMKADSIKDGAITADSLANNAVTSAKIADGTIVGADIANGTITPDKLAGGGGGGSGAWSLTGNTGIDELLNFLGTTDNKALVFKVNNRRVQRYSFAENTSEGFWSPNLLGGAEVNSVGDGVVGATIAGGGKGITDGDGFPNQILADFGVIGGGWGNRVQNKLGVIAGGDRNRTGESATVGGGSTNTATGLYSTVAGGYNNQSIGIVSTVAGGFGNVAFANNSMIGGGGGNTTGGYASTIAGGSENYAELDYATVGGGYNNTASNPISTVAGGYANLAYGVGAAIPGGYSNVAMGYCSFAAGYSAGAMTDNTFVWSDGTVQNFHSTAPAQFLIHAVSGVGINTSTPLADLHVNGDVLVNNVLGSVAGTPLLLNAANNRAMQYASVSNAILRSINVLGGIEVNQIVPGVVGGTIAGGGYVDFLGFNVPNEVQNDFGTIGGGAGNTTSGTYATVAGGVGNRASGKASAVPGGDTNRASGDYSFAAGRSAQAQHSGTFVWADAGGGGFASTGDNQFLIRAGGGVGINKNDLAGDAALDVNGLEQVLGFRMPPGAQDKYVLTSDYSGNGTWRRITGDMIESIDWGQITNIPATALSEDWKLTGNAGTDPASHFLGTTDAAPLTLRANNRRAAMFWYADTGSTSGINVLLGGDNTIGNVIGAAIGGGNANGVYGNFGTVGGGTGNTAGGTEAAVTGGYGNSANGYHAFVGGGEHNAANAQGATITGGAGNTAGAQFTAVGGGRSNTAYGEYATVSGGVNNQATGMNSAVAGGYYNQAAGLNSAIGGGYENYASGTKSTVGGGSYNSAYGLSSTVPGGDYNYADGAYSLAAGYGAKALHDGSFVWADPTSLSFQSSAENQFLIHATGGVGINTNTPIYSLDVNGIIGCFGLFFSSDARYKTNIAVIQDPLDAILGLRGVTFEWKQTPQKDFASGKQIGFIAQEVEKILPELVSTDAKGYKSVAYQNVVPVLVEAIKSLKTRYDAELRTLTEKNTLLQTQQDQLRVEIEQLKEAVRQIQSAPAKQK